MEAAQGDVEQERKQHQSTKDGSLQQKEKLLGQIKDLQDKVVGTDTLVRIIGSTVDR